MAPRRPSTQLEPRIPTTTGTMSRFMLEEEQRRRAQQLAGAQRGATPAYGQQTAGVGYRGGSGLGNVPAQPIETRDDPVRGAGETQPITPDWGHTRQAPPATGQVGQTGSARTDRDARARRAIDPYLEWRRNPELGYWQQQRPAPAEPGPYVGDGIPGGTSSSAGRPPPLDRSGPIHGSINAQNAAGVASYPTAPGFVDPAAEIRRILQEANTMTGGGATGPVPGTVYGRDAGAVGTTAQGLDQPGPGLGVPPGPVDAGKDTVTGVLAGTPEADLPADRDRYSGEELDRRIDVIAETYFFGDRTAAKLLIEDGYTIFDNGYVRDPSGQGLGSLDHPNPEIQKLVRKYLSRSREEGLRSRTAGENPQEDAETLAIRNRQAARDAAKEIKTPQLGQDWLDAGNKKIRRQSAIDQAQAMRASLELGANAGIMPGQLSGNVGQAQHTAALAAEQQELSLFLQREIANLGAQQQDADRLFRVYMEEAGDATGDLARNAAIAEAQRARDFSARLQIQLAEYNAALQSAQSKANLFSSLLQAGGVIVGSALAGPIGGLLGGLGGGAAGQAIGPPGTTISYPGQYSYYPQRSYGQPTSSGPYGTGV